MHKKNRKPLKTIFLLIAIVSISIASYQFYNHYKYKFINKTLHLSVEKKSKGMYQISYVHLVVDEIAGQLKATKVNLQFDSFQFKSKIKEGSAPSVVVNIRVPELDIFGVNTPRALLHKQITARKMELDSPLIEINLSGFLKDTSEYSPGVEIYKQILGKMQLIRVDSIALNHARLIVKDFETGKIRFEGVDLSLLLTDLLIDSLHKDDSSRILFSQNLHLTCKEIILPSKDKRYIYLLNGLEYISGTNRFNIQKLEIQPQLSETEFAKSFRYQKDRYHFIMENISLHHIDRQALWHKRILADSLIIQTSSFRVYRDISYPHDSISRIGTYPQQQLMKLNLPIYIQTVYFPQSFVEYKEKNDQSDSSGKLQFYHIDATIHHVTNISSFIRKNKICSMEFSSSLLNKDLFSGRWTMYLKDPDGKFEIKGKLGSMTASDLNPLIQPMALARMERGNIHSMNFVLEGNNTQCTGKMVFLYNDIKISILKKNDKENKYQKRVLASFASNLIMKHSNPVDGDTTHVKMALQRDMQGSGFNLIWKTIFMGLKETAGIQ